MEVITLAHEEVKPEVVEEVKSPEASSEVETIETSTVEGAKEEAVVVPKKEEPIPDPNPEPETNNEELEELKIKLAEAQEYKAKYEEAQTIKQQYEDAQNALKGYEDALGKIAEEKINALPEEYRGLVPEGSTQDKLDWLAKAESSGLYKVKEEKSIGSSTKTNHIPSETVDQVELTAIQKLATGISDHYSRAK